MDPNDLNYLVAYSSECHYENDPKESEIFNGCFVSAKGWYGDLKPSDARMVSDKILAKELKERIIQENKPAGFLPGIIWWWIGKQIVMWLVQKVIDHILFERKR